MEEIQLNNVSISLEKAYDLVLSKLEGWLSTLIKMLPNLAVAVLIMIVFVILAKLIKKYSYKGLARFVDNESLNRLLATLLNIIVLAIGLFISLSVLKLDKTVTSLLAGVGVIGIALGFAFQETMSNLLAGIYLAIRRPIKKGDLIKSQDYMGTVNHISLRTTDLISPQGQAIIIPNKDVFQSVITNYTKTGKRRMDFEMGISYGEDLEHVREVVLNAVKDLEEMEEGSEIRMFYNEFGDSSINFILMVWLKDTTQQTWWSAQNHTVIAIKKAFDKEDITIPFPIRTLDFGIKGGATLAEMPLQYKKPEQEG